MYLLHASEEKQELSEYCISNCAVAKTESKTIHCESRILSFRLSKEQSYKEVFHCYFVYQTFISATPQE